MEYEGENGTIVVEGDQLIITNSQFVVAADSGMTGQRWRIPLQAVSGVNLQEARRLSRGWLTLGLGGVEPPQLDRGSAGSNAATMTFDHDANSRFRSLYEWLLTVVEHNKAQGIDSSAVDFEPAPMLVEEQRKAQQAKAEQDKADREEREKEQRVKAAQEAWANKAAERTRSMTEMLGEKRPDIVEAALRMRRLDNTERELKQLAIHLHERETVRCLAEGEPESAKGLTDTPRGILVVLTDLRLLTLIAGGKSLRIMVFPLRLITAVETLPGLLSAELRVSIVGGTSATIYRIEPDDLRPLADGIYEGIAQQHYAPDPRASSVPSPAPPPQEEDPYQALRELASLRDDGILSEEEYEAKKLEILGRM